MQSPDFESLMKRMEVHSEAISSALLGNQGADLELASASMRQATLDLGRYFEISRELQLTGSEKLRMQAFASAMAAQRQGLLRRTAVVEHALGSLVPATRKATYSASSGPFGSNTRQSGAFKLLSA